LKEGVLIDCVIVRNKLQELKYKNEKLKRNEFLQLSLKNTIIKDAKQYYLHDYLVDLNMPIILGLNTELNTGQWIDNKTIQKDLIYNNESILSNLLIELEIKQYGLAKTNGKYSYKTNSESGFTYEK
jgi:hypothetical protein